MPMTGSTTWAISAGAKFTVATRLSSTILSSQVMNSLFDPSTTPITCLFFTGRSSGPSFRNLRRSALAAACVCQAEPTVGS